MKILYETKDGRTFMDENCALLHEAMLNKELIMVDWEGKITNDPITATVVYFEKEGLAKAFIEELSSSEDQLGHKGIDEDSIGLFLWDRVSSQYIQIPYYAVRCLQPLVEKAKHICIQEEEGGLCNA